MILYIDLETNMAHDTIWCAAYAIDDGDPVVTEDASVVRGLVARANKVVNHNLIGFDAPLLEQLWDVKVPFQKMQDTLVMSRLHDPCKDGGHSLAAWGTALGCNKGDFRDYDAGFSDEMAEYAKQDIVVTRKVYKNLLKVLKDDDFSDESIKLEHQVAYILKKQEQHGVMFDIFNALKLRDSLNLRMIDIEIEMQEAFPPIITPRIGKRGKPLSDHVEVFNPGSRQQIAKRLEGLGVKFTQQTDKGRAKVDEKVLAGIERPEARLIAEYLMLQKRVGLVDQWINYCKPTHRIHGGVITNGAVTGRMTHRTPNMAQVPSCSAPYGEQCRELFIVPKGYKLVGIDAAALELCMLAHYMNDPTFTTAVVSGKKEDGTDVHTVNMKAAGLPTRDLAKTFIYALLYGAGPGKIGRIAGGDYATGEELMSRFMENMPKLKDVLVMAKAKGREARMMIDGLDGRQLRIRSEHSALNTLLQGAGAIVMKKALVLFYNSLVSRKIPANFVLNVHDEWQLEVQEDYAEQVAQLGIEAIKKAGVDLRLACALDGEAKIGNNWAETH